LVPNSGFYYVIGYVSHQRVNKDGKKCCICSKLILIDLKESYHDLYFITKDLVFHPKCSNNNEISRFFNNEMYNDLTIELFESKIDCKFFTDDYIREIILDGQDFPTYINSGDIIGKCDFCLELSTYTNMDNEIETCESCYSELMDKEFDLYHPGDHNLSRVLRDKSQLLWS